MFQDRELAVMKEYQQDTVEKIHCYLSLADRAYGNKLGVNRSIIEPNLVIRNTSTKVLLAFIREDGSILGCQGWGSKRSSTRRLRVICFVTSNSLTKGLC